ncbi:MAG: hypothetical protein AAB612_01270 [Patescibacteria group bacterium]
MRNVFVFGCCVVVFLWFVPQVFAVDVQGVHILNTGELDAASALLKNVKTKDQWDYVTIPFTLDDTHRLSDWQRFFSQARELKFQPIIRLATRFNNGSWVVPTKKDVVDLTAALSSLEWPVPNERIVVVFNEPNHANEWGGVLDPEGYAGILEFTGYWLHAENVGYVVLPAGLDLSAPNGKITMEEFTYLERMFRSHPDVLEIMDGWTSHSYPNPGFTASPTAQGKNSLRGFEFELAFLKKYSQKKFPIYITETGWIETKQTAKWLSWYYEYAVTNIWSDPRIRAVTPFVLKGAPGSFAQFSFYDSQGKPTLHFDAYKKALGK